MNTYTTAFGHLRGRERERETLVTNDWSELSLQQCIVIRQKNFTPENCSWKNNRCTVYTRAQIDNLLLWLPLLAVSLSSCVRLLSLFAVLLLPYSASNAFAFTRPISMCLRPSFDLFYPHTKQYQTRENYIKQKKGRETTTIWDSKYTSLPEKGRITLRVSVRVGGECKNEGEKGEVRTLNLKLYAIINVILSLFYLYHVCFTWFLIGQH